MSSRLIWRQFYAKSSALAYEVILSDNGRDSRRPILEAIGMSGSNSGFHKIGEGTSILSDKSGLDYDMFIVFISCSYLYSAKIPAAAYRNSERRRRH